MVSLSSLSDFSSSSSDDSDSEGDSNRNDNEDNDGHNGGDNGDDDWGDEALADEVGAFGSPSLGGAPASRASLAAFFTESAVVRARELKELNVDVII